MLIIGETDGPCYRCNKPGVRSVNLSYNDGTRANMQVVCDEHTPAWFRQIGRQPESVDLATRLAAGIAKCRMFIDDERWAIHCRNTASTILAALEGEGADLQHIRRTIMELTEAEKAW